MINSRLLATVITLFGTIVMIRFALAEPSPYVQQSTMVAPLPMASPVQQPTPPSPEDYARALARIAYLEGKLETCKANHLAAYEAAWSWYEQLLDCRAQLGVCETADIPEDSENPWLMPIAWPDSLATPEDAP